MTHRIKNLRKLNLHSLQHNHHHSKLKHLVEHALEEEKRYWPLFVGLFLVVAAVLMWSYRENMLPTNELRPAAPTVFTQGYEQGIFISQNLGKGSQIAPIEVEVNLNNPQSFEGFADGLVTSTNLSKTGASKPVETQLLQKSLLATFYLGETTDVLKSSLEKDLQLLHEIENVLSVDLFQFLNQSMNRADSLENHLNLLAILQKRAQTRQNELTTTLNFLEQRIAAQEKVLEASETTFFNQMDQAIQPTEDNAFITTGSQGEALKEDLDEFVKIQQQQVEDKAKMGAYESLRSYYQYYQPILQERIEAISANRDALIAGVRVVDLPGIESLGGPGLIVRE